MSLALNFRSREAYKGDAVVSRIGTYSTIESITIEPEATCLVALKGSSSYAFTPLMLRELLECAKNTSPLRATGIQTRALISKRHGIFSLGGDLSFFRECIARQDVDSLTGYAKFAIDLVWESITASGVEGMTSVALVQGEAQGGGFEAALAAHILIAERGTCFGFPEGLFGLFPGMGARALLTARGAGNHASKIIGSARRYQAEELYAMGIIDFLAEPGRGMDLLRAIQGEESEERILNFRGRFAQIKKPELVDTVLEWVDLAMRLPQKHLRTIDYLIQAQERARPKSPLVRVI